MAYDESYKTCRRYKGKKGAPEKSENIMGGFYKGTPKMGDSPAQQVGRRMGNYGKNYRFPDEDQPFLFGRMF